MDECADRYPPLYGGALCLDLANTLDPRVDPATDRDHLGSDYAGLLAWAAYAGLLQDPEVEDLLAAAARAPSDAAQVLTEVRQLRAAVIAVFDPPGGHPKREDLDELRDRYVAARAAAILTGDHDGVTWRWPRPATDLAAPLWPMSVSAVDLLTSPAHARVRVCDGERCGSLFVDRTRNGSRRWCLMRYCGNVGKSRRQAAKRRAARASAREAAP